MARPVSGPFPGQVLERASRTTTRRGRIPTEPVGPGRRLVIGSITGAVIGGSLLGLVHGVFNPPDPPPGRVIEAPAESVRPTATSSAAGPDLSADPARNAGPSVSAPLKTVRQTEAAPPQDLIDPSRDRNLRFTLLDDIWRDDQGRIVLKVTPLRVSERGRVQKADDQEIEITVREDATIFGEFFLGDQRNVQLNRFRSDEAFRLLRDALDRGAKPTLWIKRSRGLDGPAIYVAEQRLD